MSCPPFSSLGQPSGLFERFSVTRGRTSSSPTACSSRRIAGLSRKYICIMHLCRRLIEDMHLKCLMSLFIDSTRRCTTPLATHPRYLNFRCQLNVRLTRRMADPLTRPNTPTFFYSLAAGGPHRLAPRLDIRRCCRACRATNQDTDIKIIYLQSDDSFFHPQRGTWPYQSK